MAIELSSDAEILLSQSTKEPHIVLKIDGIETVFGASIVQKFARIGDGSEIGDPELNQLSYYIGGYNALDDQDNLITLDGTSTSIKQTLNMDKGEGSSISTLSIALMDDGYATRLITPGELVDDILQRKCLVYMGVGGSFPDDYNVIFRGVVTEIAADPGKIILTLNHPDDKKRTNIFKKIETKLNNLLLEDQQLDDELTVVLLDSVSNFLEKTEGPDPDDEFDESFKAYIRVDDEIIEYDRVIPAQSFPMTVTIASPAVITSFDHGLVNNEPLTFSTDGALPTGLGAGTIYYVKNKTDDTFEVSLTPGGAVINTSGSQSGSHLINLTARIQGCTRGAIGTQAAVHDDDADVSTIYRLAGNGVHLALKLMLSGDVGERPALQVTSINIGGEERYANALYFKGVDVQTEYGLNSGDWLHESGGSQFAENNVRDKRIVEIIRGLEGDFVIIDDVTFTDDVYSLETDNELVADFTSQFATLPDGYRMTMDEVDVARHVELYSQFLSSVEYDFYIKEGIENGKEFMEKEIYLPMGAYSLPRKARASMGYHVGPIPGQSVPTFNESNIRMASKIQLKRSSNRNFYNEILFKFEEDALEEKFKAGYVVISQDSKNRIPGPNRTLVIESKGMRTSLSAEVIALTHGLRRLRRYQYGAETLSFNVMFKDGYTVEIGDIIIVDGTVLQLPDIKFGQKGLAPRFFEVINKDYQLKTGDIKLEVMDTNYSDQGRYGLIAPSSFIKDGESTTAFTLRSSFATPYGSAEFKKWRHLKNASIIVRSADFSTVSDSVIVSADSNKITVNPPLDFIPSPGMIMELAPYNDEDITEQVKLIYCHMSDGAPFEDGTDEYQML